MLRSTYLTYRILGPLLFSGLHRILSPPPDKVLLFLNTLVCLHPCTYAFTDIISLFFTFYLFFFFPFLPTNLTQWNCLIFCHSGCLPARRPDVIFGRGIPFLPPVIKRPDEGVEHPRKFSRIPEQWAWFRRPNTRWTPTKGQKTENGFVLVSRLPPSQKDLWRRPGDGQETELEKVGRGTVRSIISLKSH